jgi:iron(II)-dependent oxidoreductase
VRPLTIAFVLLTYAEDAPAGIERSIAALADGLRRLGHRALVLTAAGSQGRDAPGLVRLKAVRLPQPAVEAHLAAALGDPCPVAAEVRAALSDRPVDVACWADTSWGLGYLAPAPDGVRTALMVRVLRNDPLFDQALARRPDTVLTNSRFLIDQAAEAGHDTSAWKAVPNGLLTNAVPVPDQRREARRRCGPVRIVARAEPHKGIRELIDATPADLDRPVEIVLAAGFEYWPGMQTEVIAGCRRAAAACTATVRVLPALPWRDVPLFLADAALTVISTTSPESFCNVAAEALSVGTPVVAYDFGHVPVLAGPSGVMVPPDHGPGALWAAARGLLADPGGYHAAARAAPGRVAGHTPAAAASAFLAAVTS